MIEQFHQTEHLSQEQLNDFLKKLNTPAILHFTVMYSFIIGSAVAIVYTYEGPWYLHLLSVFALAIGFCSSFACEHETSHNTAFKSRFLNTWAGRLCSFVQLYPSTLFQEFHFTHHRFTHDPLRDPEISFAGKPIPILVGNLPFYLSWISGFPLLMAKLVMLSTSILGMPEWIKKRSFPFVRNSVRFTLFLEALAILLFHSALIYLAIQYHSGIWSIYWALLLGHCLLSSYLVPEHNGLPHEGSIMQKTRSMNAPKIVKFIMWNMPYHAEHHAYPAIPFHALPALHKALEKDILHQENYLEVHAKVVSGKF